MSAHSDREMAILHNKIRKMSLPQFTEWVKRYAAECIRAGMEQAEQDGTRWEDTQIYDLLRAERIGAERAQRIVRKLACESPAGKETDG